MERLTFPTGVFPELLSLGGQTYMGYCQGGRGVVMRRWPDGRPGLASEIWSDPLAFTKGYLRMTTVNGLPLAMYYRDEPAPAHVLVVRADVADADGRPIPTAPWRIPFVGNNPCTWGPGGLIGVQNPSAFVLCSNWPDQPVAGPMSRQGAAMGLSRFDLANPVPVRLWDEDDALTFELYRVRNPVWLPNGTIVGDGQDGGVGFVIDGVVKLMDYGEVRHTSRGTVQANGNYSVGWWDKDGRSVSVACDVSEDDLYEMPVVEPFAEPKFVGVFFGSSEQYGYDEYTGNVETLFGPYSQWPGSDYRKMAVQGRSVIITPGAKQVPEDENLGHWCDNAEADAVTDVRRFRYSDSRVYVDRVPHRDSDVRLFQAYPRKGEPPPVFEHEVHEQMNRFSGQKGIVAKFYPGNPPQDFNEAALEPYFDVFVGLLRRHDCMGMLAFDGSRSGIKYHPRWRMWLDAIALAAGKPLPAFNPVGPSPQPPPAKRLGGATYEYLFTA